MREQIGMVFQSFNLFSHLTVVENLMLAQVRLLKRSRREACEKSMELLQMVGLADKALSLPAQLSGGQQQRCAIARALIKNPKLLLCDEPTGALDSKTSRDILILLEAINAKYGTTMLIVTHNNSIKNMVHKVIIIKDGLVKKEYLNETRTPAAELEDL
jgi:putative ABC transport system ATP-binding protein